MKNIGDYTMVTTETIWAGYTTVRVLSTAGSNSVFGRLVNAVSGLSDAAKAFLEAAAPPLYFLLFFAVLCRLFRYPFTCRLFRLSSG